MSTAQASPHATSPRRPAVPLGLAGTLAIVVAFESYVAAHPADFAEFSASDWRLAKRAVAGESRDAQILCFGDSLLKFGVVPEVIERRTGLATFNLSLMGGQSASSYFLLRRAVEAGARPRVVILDCQDLPSKPCFPDLRGLGLAAHVRSWPELLSLTEAAELAWSARDPSFFGAVVVREILPSFKARREVRSNLGQLVRKGDTSSRRQFRAGTKLVAQPRHAAHGTTAQEQHDDRAGAHERARGAVVARSGHAEISPKVTRAGDRERNGGGLGDPADEPRT